MSTWKEVKHLFAVLRTWRRQICVNPDVLAPVYLLQCLQGVGVHFSDVVGFCDSIKVLTNRVHVHQAVVCHLDSLEVREKPRGKKRFGCLDFTSG